ncbi:hypothetical protein UJ101_02416 [Flavobacteriaceae bacterium UJ101]|nr:hypothetical protein UJ101_02416 [Flavobacteriaceae bacterium UJ101]
MKWIKAFFYGEIIPFDKMLHFFVGFFISTVCSFLSIEINLIILTIFSIGKEYYDQYIKKTHFDIQDALATFLGGIAAILVLYFLIPYLK